jgi:hypothetical protein
MKGCKLRNCVNWQGALKPKGLKQIGVKQGLGIYEVPSSVLQFTTLACILFPFTAIMKVAASQNCSLASGESTHIQCKQVAKIGGAKDSTFT